MRLRSRVQSRDRTFAILDHLSRQRSADFQKCPENALEDCCWDECVTVTPPAPLANNSTVSLVEVSPSIEMQLNWLNGIIQKFL